MIKAIIFDCFGVVISDTLESTYTSLGGDFQKDKDKIQAILDASNKGEIPSSFPPMAKLLGISESTYATAISSGRHIDQDLLDYIRTDLSKNYKVAMLSNIAKGRLPQLFGEGFLEQYFEVVVASGDVGFAKPEAQAYEIVADKLGVRLDECVFTDDRQEYVEGAQSVGMEAILYENLPKFKKELEEVLHD